jgi:hypothetical protein
MAWHLLLSYSSGLVKKQISEPTSQPQYLVENILAANFGIFQPGA